MSEVITQETVPVAPLESAPEGEGADSQISLEKLNEFLGKDYKDVDTALKSVKDTFSFVGKRDELRETLEGVMKATGSDEQTVLEKLQSMSQTQETNPESVDQVAELQKQMLAERQQYSEDRFFDKNPDFEGIKNIIKPLKGTAEFSAMSWDEFKDTDTVKAVFETYSTAQEAQSKKSVVESNPRIGAASDKMSNARQALESGDMANARDSAIGAVVDLIAE